jgi:hypothetical protein
MRAAHACPDSSRTPQPMDGQDYQARARRAQTIFWHDLHEKQE